MATPVDKSATRTSTSTSISGPAYKVAVGGAPRGKPPRRYIISSTTQKTVIEEYRVVPHYLKPSSGSCHDSCKNAADEWKQYKTTRNLGPRKRYAMTTSRYLIPSTGSCHESCKHGKKDEPMELRTTRTLASRKRSVSKNNGVKRTVVSVERKKITEIKPKPKPKPKPPRANSKIRAVSEPVKVMKLKNSLPAKKVTKPVTVKQSSSKNKKVGKNRGSKPVSPRKDQTMITKTELRLMIADKIQEMILQEAEDAEAGVEEEETMVQSPETQTTESATPQDSEEVLDEDSSSSSNEQVSNSENVDDEACEEEVVEEEEEFEYDEEGYILEEEEEGDDEKKGRRYRVVGTEEKGGVRFRRGRVVEVEGEGGPRRLKFKAGTELEGGEEEESEKVNLKHQEVGKKEAQELLNSVIEETASKLVEDMKTKVGALVGAFETVISRQDEIDTCN